MSVQPAESIEAVEAKPNTGLVYEPIDEDKLNYLRQKHAWIADPIYHASESIRKTPFFDWVQELQSPLDFKRAATQLYYHSATFPKVMGIMLGLTPFSENGMMPFYARHAFGEADHHQLLMKWMLKYDLLDNEQDIKQYPPGTETNACVNYAYQMAVEQDREKWLVGLNSGIERCSNDFFKAVAPKMHKLGAGDIYFDIHVEADEHHSIMGLEYMEVQSPSSIRGRELILKALEGIELWGRMINSWIDIDLNCKFDLTGHLRKLAKH